MYDRPTHPRFITAHLIFFPKFTRGLGAIFTAGNGTSRLAIVT